MTIYKKRVKTSDPRFQGRAITIMTSKTLDVIPVADSEVICNSCNRNINDAEKEEDRWGWLIYLSKNDLKKDRPYDFYCDEDAKRIFPKAQEAN